jgi:hypothetical protein
MKAPLSPFDIGWLVGLIEGDGCFTFDGKHPVVALKITDLDTAQRFATLLGTVVCGPYHYEGQQLGDKPYYVTKIAGRKARNFMSSTAPMFSIRRRQQIRMLIGDQASIDEMLGGLADLYNVEHFCRAKGFGSSFEVGVGAK